MARTKIAFVQRPFEGLPGEADLVALREVVPAATATVKLTKEYGGHDLLFVTILPAGWAALRRKDGVMLVALHGASASGDASRDVAAAILAVIECEPGEAVESLGLIEPGPRLQDILDITAPFEVTTYEGYDYWLPDGVEDPEVKAALEQANEGIFPTAKLASVPSAYWCRMGAKEFLRWSQAADEERLLDGLARLHARRASAIEEGTKLLGAFRSCGVVMPVWELVRGSEASDIEAACAAFKVSLDAAVADDAPLTFDERRARAGLVSRQVTIR